MNAPTEPLAVTVPEALRLTGLGRTTLYRLISENKLQAVKIGTRTLIKFATLKQLLEPEAEVA